MTGCTVTDLANKKEYEFGKNTCFSPLINFLSLTNEKDCEFGKNITPCFHFQYTIVHQLFCCGCSVNYGIVVNN